MQNNLFLAGLLCVISMSSVAKEGDLKQEVKIKAVSQTADIKNNQLIFFGPVEVTQGSIKIHASELRAYSPENDGAKVLVAIGDPATYSQILDDGRPASASAKEIRYELASRTLTLKGDASLDQAGSQVKGNLIRYNIGEQKLIAESSGDGDDRVITIIQPETYQEEPKPMPQSEPQVNQQEQE
ncbi:lipopolysaccharide transport periplasmic protein LptA [Shewanella sp. AS16]|uniref:lipopolysaccharide transport periplasmic protein LptA n=1 Tax=Shewanella sp. AS16 TaxID=2907625 RepID=UPI001F346A6C|nr:lipopolysaccharide transport periplasmic protein LptA [Shewanella sp. AS16]MCE9687086.1 lipopolysaccharide transport periplasmic protein LptA [Shewanella sp. AS16]